MLNTVRQLTDGKLFILKIVAILEMEKNKHTKVI
jgi:hypothetical protein